MSIYRYKLFKEKHGSDWYGPCEVCKKPAQIMFHQVEERKYKHSDGATGWTRHECTSLWGHKTCLMKKRRKK